MGKHDYFLLIPPFMVALFAIAFLAAARFDRTLPGARTFALAYAGGAVSLGMDYVLRHDIEAWAGYPANLPYIVSGGIYAAAVFHRFGRPASLAICVGVPLVQLIGYGAFVLVDSLPMRVLVMNLGATATLFAPVLLCWPLARTPLDRLILALIGFGALQYAVRSGVLLGIEGSALTAANYAESLLVKTTSFATALIGVVIALTLLVSYALMVIGQARGDARTDSLTGLLNRRGLEEALAGGGAGEGPATIVLCDLDRFKSVNDALGHAVGDRVLAAFGEVLRDTARRHDVVARLGGEEFLLVLRRATPRTAALHAELVRSVVRSLQMRELGERRLTASFGIADWPPGTPVERAIARADDALYAAKSGGRNRIEIAPETVAPPASAPALAAE